MQWLKRAKKKETESAVFRRWASTDGAYAVIEVTSKLGLPKRYLLVRAAGNGNEIVISRHRTKARAQSQGEKYGRTHGRD